MSVLDKSSSPPSSLPPEDPLDAADYDPIDHLNALFSHPSTLNQVSPVAASLDRHVQSLDADITQLVRTQSATNADSLQRISAAKTDLAELFENIDTVRERAMRTEEAITAMTADIKKLDSTKRNLTLSMTMLKRLQMLTTAFEQLKSNTRTRQYRECASLLSAVLELMAHFKSYRSISQIATLSRNVADVKAELLEQVCEDFELVFVKGEVGLKRNMLTEACLVIDALGDTARQRIINWYCNTQLREYRKVFRGSDEAGSLDNISRRYAWFKRMLKVYDEEHAGIFPPSWKVGEVIANSYCEGTRDDFKGILAKAARKETGSGVDVNLLLSALQETLDFEHYLERRFSTERASIDTMSSKDDRPAIFGKSISEAFEPYLYLWVEAQDKQLSQLIPKYRQQPLRPPDADEHDAPLSSVLPSSIELFHFYRQTLSQCAKLSTGPNLLELSNTFKKYLDAYADDVLMRRLSSATHSVEDIATILNTADYCHTTTTQLQDRIKSRIDAVLAENIDFEKQADAFLTVISRTLSILVNRVTSALEPAWREMRNTPWRTMEQVGDQSGYVSVLVSALNSAVAPILGVFGKDAWKRTFCDRVVDAVITAFVNTLVTCRPISSTAAEQMLLDAYALRSHLEKLIILPPSIGGRDGSPTRVGSTPGTPVAASPKEKPEPPATYIKAVHRTTARLDALLKTLQVSTSPAEGIVQAYLIHIADKKPENFRKILELKGVRAREQQAFLELFRAHVPAHDGLVESSPLMNTLVLSGTDGGGVAAVKGMGVGGMGGMGGIEGFGSAVLAAARDGVERWDSEREGEESGRGRLGRLFRSRAGGDAGKR